MASGTATVKAVISGDTVVLMGASKTGPPPEIMLTLASLQAPKLARSSEQHDEPYAFTSREFLRNLLIGKQVRFKVEYKVAAINRDFASIYLDDENVCVLVAKEGMAKVKTLEQSRDGCSPDLEEMLRVQEIAVAEKKGIYSEDGTKAALHVSWSGLTGEELLGRFKGQQIPAIVEMVRDGAAMRVILLSTMQIVNFALSGVQCPRVNPPPGTEPQGPAPFSREAKLFTEVRLLHRKIKVKLEGTDKFGNLYGSVIHPSGHNISIELLKNGLGKMSDWSSEFLSVNTRTEMRNAEKSAKLLKTRVWHDYVPPVLQATDTSLQGLVVEVVSGDCIVVALKSKNYEEQRIYLSSIRAPRMGNARRNEPNAPYALDSKEAMRSKVIGKTVSIEIEYERNNPNLADNSVMTFASVFLESAVAKKKGGEPKPRVNIAESIVADGLAEVVRHKQGEEKSGHYDLLVAAEAQAKASKKGLHSTKPSPEPRITDLCFEANKAKQYLPFLQREKTLRAVVEHVYAGNRFKVYVPKENCTVNFIVAGIKCPQPAKPSKDAEPYGEDARRFARRSTMQRNVLIEVDDMDRMGNAFGPMYIGTKDFKNNFGCALLHEGYARVDDFSIERTSASSDLLQAEEVAKKARVHVWKNFAENEEETTTKVAVKRTSDEVLPVVRLSEITNATTFYIQNVSDRSVATIEEKMRDFTQQVGLDGKAFEIKKGVLCAALFDDGQGPVWNRARVEAKPTSGVQVKFIDYGNTEILPPTRLRPLDPSLVHHPAQAKECVLGFIKPFDTNAEFAGDAAHMLNDLAWGKNMTALVHGHDSNGRLSVSLLVNNKNVTESILEQGVARVDRKAIRYAEPYQKAIVDKLVTAQESARRRRLCMWQYGDVESDED
ncbi:nuclease [Thraustotheca clavata]|uniref:Nuclease n=1 Tax=Thraustotheca clavata TaxID=74557 RepID=A0A1W0A2V7_9STRA|nr:nuclease [Thraustotheca clavata]